MEKDMSDYRETVLKCPFCEEYLEMPEKIKTPFGEDLDGGTCSCGAVYVFDETGRMLGEAYSDALAFVYDWDYDAAFSADEDDYEEAVIRYNSRIGKFMGGQGSFRDRGSRFFFIRRTEKSYNKGNGGS